MILKCVLQIVSFGAIFSIIGVLQRLNEAGFIADSLKWFLIAMTLLLPLTQRLLEYCALPVTRGTSTKGVAPGSAVCQMRHHSGHGQCGPVAMQQSHAASAENW